MNSLHNEVLMILGFQLTVGLPEIIICELGALILGFTIHFFWNSKKDLDLNNQTDQNAGISDNDNWKLKYYNDMDMQERAQQQLRDRLTQVQETERVASSELEEIRAEREELREELEIVHGRLADAEEQLKPAATETDQPDQATTYLSQLRLAQEKLAEHNGNITRLLEQTRLVEESEKKTQELLHQNEELHEQVRSAGQQLGEKEAEISHLRHQQKLAEEMGTRLDKVYEEYSTLQEKLLKLQTYLTQPHNRGTDYDELKDAYFKLGKEHDEMKLKYLSLREENQRLNRIIADTEEKLKEANFQRQQYQKRSAFLEELNHDLQEISEHNKKIESQLRRVSDMESLLTKITQSGLRDVL